MSENNMVKIHGSIHRLRKMSGFSFLILRTAHQLIQCILEPEKCEILGPDGSPWEETLKEEMCIRMEAQKVEEPRSRTGWELHPVHIRILSVPAETMPVVIQDVYKRQHRRGRRHRHGQAGPGLSGRSEGSLSHLRPAPGLSRIYIYITVEELKALDNVKGISLNVGENRIVNGSTVEIRPELYELEYPMISVDYPGSRCETQLQEQPDEEALKAFVFETCRAEANWNMKNFIEDQVELIRRQVGDSRAVSYTHLSQSPFVSPQATNTIGIKTAINRIRTHAMEFAPRSNPFFRSDSAAEKPP